MAGKTIVAEQRPYVPIEIDRARILVNSKRIAWPSETSQSRGNGQAGLSSKRYAKKYSHIHCQNVDGKITRPIQLSQPKTERLAKRSYCDL